MIRFEQNVSCDQKMLLIKYAKVFIIFVSILRLSFNSTRRTRFDTKLGFFPKITLPTSFDKLESNGGIASELTVYIAKKYPVVYNDVKNPGKGALSQKMADALEMNQQREQDLEQVRVHNNFCQIL